MSLAPTTVGTGPFKAAIEFDDVLYVKDIREYETEQEAYEEAQTLYQLACGDFRSRLNRNYFVPFKRR